MKALRWVVDRLVWFSAGIAALALLFEVIVILVDVVGRALGRPLYGSLDMVTMAMVILVFGAMALCDRRGGHVAVDLLQSFFSERLNRYIAATLSDPRDVMLWAEYEKGNRVRDFDRPFGQEL